MEAVSKSKQKQTCASRKTYGNVNNVMVGTNHLHVHVGNSGDEVKDVSPNDKRIPQNNVLPHSVESAPSAEETRVKQSAESREEIKTKQMTITGYGKYLADSQQLPSQDVEGYQINNATSSHVPFQRKPLSDETDTSSNEKGRARDPEVEIQDSEGETTLPNSLDLANDSIVGPVSQWDVTNPKTTENRRQRGKSEPADFKCCEIIEESIIDGEQTHIHNTAADFRQHGLICDTTTPHPLSKDSSLVTVQCERNISNLETPIIIPSDDSGLDSERSEPKELCTNQTKTENADVTSLQMSKPVTVTMTSSKGQEPSLISASSSIDEGFKSSFLFDEEEYCIIEAEDVDLEHEGESGYYEISEHPGSDIDMHGHNILNVNIGDCIVRSHSLEENTHVKMRYRKIKQRKQHVDGMRQNNSLEIVIHIDPYPEAEQAAVEQLNQDDTLCSRITTAFYNLGCSIKRFRFGSVVIELRPVSKDSVEQINRAIANGTFDDIILDILKQKPVFQLIKGKDVTIDVDFSVPEDFLFEEGCSGGLKTNVNDSSGKPLFGVCVRVEDEGKVQGKSLSPVAGQRQQGSAKTAEEVRRLLRDVVTGIEIEGKMKEELVIQLRKLAEELDIKQRQMSKAKIALASGGIVGSALTIAGFALAPVTFGASLGLTIAGLGIGVSSGVGGITTSIVDRITNKKTMTETQTILNKYQAVVSNLLNLLQELKASKRADIHRLIAEELTGADAATLLNLKRIFSETKSGTEDEGQSEFSTTDGLTSAFDNGSFTRELATNAGTVASRTMVTTFETGLRALKIGGIVVAVLTVPLDVYTLVKNSIKLHKNTPFETSEEIRKLADRIESYNPLDPRSESKMTTERSTKIVKEAASKDTTHRAIRNKSDKAYVIPVDTGK